MARIKQGSRRKTTKRLPLATMPHRNPKNIKDIKAKTNNNVKQIKQTLSNQVDQSSSASSNSSNNKCNSLNNKWFYFSSPAPNQTLFTKGQTNKMQGLPEDAGKWLLFSTSEYCDLVGESHHHYTWKVAKALVKDFKNTGIISTKCSAVEKVEDSENDAQGVVCCYTSNYKDKLSVKRAADAIFKVYPYPLSMYYKTEKNVDEMYDENNSKVVSIYKYTIENKFFERCASESYGWRLVEFENEAAFEAKGGVAPTISYREIMPCMIVSHHWLYVSSFQKNGEKFVVNSLDYIEDLPDTSGKWLLFNTSSEVCGLGGVTHHDFAWKSLKHLVINHKKSKIIAIKCSTNKVDANHPGKGVTYCYTADSTDKISIKKAAKTIRKTFHYPDIMYYKTEEDSDVGATYKYTPDDILYERTENQKTWTLIE